MTAGLEGELPAAIEFAYADLLKVADDFPRESLPVESQVRAALYAYFKQKGCIVHVDAGYPGGEGKCDLRVHAPSGQELWVELKRGWYGKGLVNRVGDRVETWEADVERLKKLPKGTLKVFVLVAFFERDPGDCKEGLANSIADFHPQDRIHDSGSRDFRWNGLWDTPITKLRAWAWRF